MNKLMLHPHPSVSTDGGDIYQQFDSAEYFDAKPPAESNSGYLAGVINLIIRAIPVGVIYNLSQTPTIPDLLIVLERKCTKAYSEFETIVELAMLGYPNGTCTLHNYGLLNAQIVSGHLFYGTVCVEENMIYRKDVDQVFTRPDPLAVSLMKAKLAEQFDKGIDKAKKFYTGAQYYLEDCANEMAIFMLQQACELTYRCLLNALRGKDLKCHSPAILRRHVKRFAPEVIGVFDTVEEREIKYLEILEEAYVQSRYTMTYVINQETIVFLNERVGLLITKTIGMMRKKGLC
jgi:HEPN domain-containing protein